MGWTTHYSIPHDIKAELTNICRPWVPVQMSRVGSTWYIAATHDTLTTAFVILTSTKNGEWSYKGMDETVGPCETKAPASLIRRLSPTASPYALAWRQECMDYAARPKFKKGDRIRLAQPANFKGYPPQTEFTCTSYTSRGKQRSCWVNDTIGLCRLSTHALEGATLV